LEVAGATGYHAAEEVIPAAVAVAVGRWAREVRGIMKEEPRSAAPAPASAPAMGVGAGVGFGAAAPAPASGVDMRMDIGMGGDGGWRRPRVLRVVDASVGLVVTLLSILAAGLFGGSGGVAQGCVGPYGVEEEEEGEAEEEEKEDTRPVLSFGGCGFLYPYQLGRAVLLEPKLTRVDRVWCHRMKLQFDELLSNVPFNITVSRYSWAWHSTYRTTSTPTVGLDTTFLSLFASQLNLSDISKKPAASSHETPVPVQREKRFRVYREAPGFRPGPYSFTGTYYQTVRNGREAQHDGGRVRCTGLSAGFAAAFTAGGRRLIPD
jgi:hypothetical protein